MSDPFLFDSCPAAPFIVSRVPEGRQWAGYVAVRLPPDEVLGPDEDDGWRDALICTEVAARCLLDGLAAVVGQPAPPEPEIRGYVVVVHLREAGVAGEGWEMGWSEIHPTREAAEADAAEARAGDDVWNPRPEAHVCVVTALPPVDGAEMGR